MRFSTNGIIVLVFASYSQSTATYEFAESFQTAAYVQAVVLRSFILICLWIEGNREGMESLALWFQYPIKVKKFPTIIGKVAELQISGIKVN